LYFTFSPVNYTNLGKEGQSVRDNKDLLDSFN